ncbi:MAG: hypothetical protein ACOCRK_03290 [bacterium]
MKNIMDEKYIMVANQLIDDKKTELTPLCTLEGEIINNSNFPDDGRVFWNLKIENNLEVVPNSLWIVGIRESNIYTPGNGLCKFEVNINKREKIKCELIDFTDINVSEEDLLNPDYTHSFIGDISSHGFFKIGESVYGPFDFIKINSCKYKITLQDYQRFIYYSYKWDDFKNYTVKTEYQYKGKEESRYILKNDKEPDSTMGNIRDGRSQSQLAKWYLDTIHDLHELPNEIYELLSRENINKARDNILQLTSNNKNLIEHRLSKLMGIKSEIEEYIASKSDIIDPLLFVPPLKEILEKRILNEINKRRNDIDDAIVEEQNALFSLNEEKDNLKEELRLLKKDYNERVNTLKGLIQHLQEEKDRMISDYLISKELLTKEISKKSNTPYHQVAVSTENKEEDQEIIKDEKEFIHLLEDDLDINLPTLNWYTYYELHGAIKTNPIVFLEGYEINELIEHYIKLTGGKIKSIRVESGWLGKEDILGHIDTESGYFKSAEHGFLEYLISALEDRDDNIYFLNLKDCNHSNMSNYLAPIFDLISGIYLNVYGKINTIKESNILNYSLIWPENFRVIATLDSSHFRQTIPFPGYVPVIMSNKSKDKIDLQNIIFENKDKDKLDYKVKYHDFIEWKNDLEDIANNDVLKQLIDILQRHSNLIERKHIEAMLQYFSANRHLFPSDEETFDSMLCLFFYPIIIHKNISLYNLQEDLDEFIIIPRFIEKLEELGRKKQGENDAF